MKPPLLRGARPVVVFAVLALAVAPPAPAGPDQDRLVAEYDAYRQVIVDTVGMVRDGGARTLARKHGLEVVDLTWEDTGRFKGSSVGPNISDMTIQVQQMDPRDEKFRLYCMPVLRAPNFGDRTGDISPERFFLKVGNERGGTLQRVSLAELLRNPTTYLSRPDSWKAKVTSLYDAKRDSHVLVSAQACFLPVPKAGEATFNPVLFNYQSVAKDPAVLTILATREGTSITVIDNQRDRFQAGPTWGQRLFFNQQGQRASLTGRRKSEFVDAPPPVDPQDPGRTTPEAAGQRGLNLVLLIQVPLKQKRPWPPPPTSPGPPTTAAPAGGAAPRGSDVEDAVIGHGKVEGPFTEIDDLEITRDPAYPVRVTVQFYKATSNGVVSEADIADIAAQIERVYKEADYVGSLVTEGDTGRPTEHGGPKFEPPGWWAAFWARHRPDTKQTPEEALEMLRRLHGPDYVPANEAELERQLERLAAGSK